MTVSPATDPCGVEDERHVNEQRLVEVIRVLVLGAAERWCGVFDEGKIHTVGPNFVPTLLSHTRLCSEFSVKLLGQLASSGPTL